MNIHTKINQNKTKGITTMKKKNINLISVGFVFLLSSVFAKGYNTENTNTARTTEGLENAKPSIHVLNINNIAYWIAKDGAYTTAGSPNGTMADYPIFTGGFIYSDGMLWGAKVKDVAVVDGSGNPTGEFETGAQEIQVGGSTYYHGLSAGRVIYDADGKVVGGDDPTSNHVWRVRPDYQNADLSVDAANYNSASAATVTAAQIAAIKSQYDYDWNNWPGAWGAPFTEVNGVDGYQAATWNGTEWTDGDIPGYPGAAQTVWVVANDVPTKFADVDGDGIVGGGDDLASDGVSDSTTTLNSAPSLYGSNPIGVELQITLWGYSYGASDPLGNNIFKEAKLKYTGLPGTPDGAWMDSVYFTQWSDPDLGTYTDDYVGCDVDLSFGYVYNGNRLDGVFNSIFNLPVPAGGYDFLQGPADNKDIDGDGDVTEYLPMTAFTYFGAGSAISDPDLGQYAGSLQFFNLMEGFLPRPAWPTQIPWTDLSTGEATKFAVSGDPVTGSGWIDGVQLPPGDRRLVMASGPFMMNKGETATVVFGIAAGMGLDNVSSVSVAKFHDKYGQYAYDQSFNLPVPPTSPMVEVLEHDGEIMLDWGVSEQAVENTEGTPSQGFEFEGYNVYQLPTANSPLSEGIKVATFDKVNLVQLILDPSVDPTTGFVIETIKQTGTDSGVQRYYGTGTDEIRGRPMSNGITYHFAVTAYSYLADNEGRPFKVLESTETRVAATPRSLNPGEVVNAAFGDEIEVTKTAGTADVSLDVNVVNYTKLTGDSYEVSFSETAWYVGADGQWTSSDPAAAGRVFDVSPSSVTGFYLTNPDPATIDVVFNVSVVSPDYNYADGVKIEFPAGTVINSVDGGGALAMIGEGDDSHIAMYGDVSEGLSTGGFFSGGQVISANINKPAGFPADMVINYTIYDDGWAQAWCDPAIGGVDCNTCIYYGIGMDCDGAYLTTVQNATGTYTVEDTAFAYFMQLEKYWNLKNTTDNTDLLTNQTYVSGADVLGGASAQQLSKLHHNVTAALETEGFQVNVNGGYAAPSDVLRHEYTLDEANAALYGDAYYDIDSYLANGWAASAMAVDAYGSGISSVDILQRDIEVRFTGEWEDSVRVPVTTGGVAVDAYNNTDWSEGADGKPDSLWYYTCANYANNCEGDGGSFAWHDGARGYDIADHPDQGNVLKDGDPFRIWVPFEVWDMEARDASGALVEGGKQIDILIYDRIQNNAAMGNGDDPGYMYSFNPYNRMYTHFIHLDYKADGEYLNEAGNAYVITDNLTWNVVWWDAQFNQGDKVLFVYANPIQSGSDVFTFSTTTSSRVASNDISNVSVYPNPYYGTHELEASRSDKYISFNNLPVEATIDIYSLGGVFVKSMTKNDNSQFAKWDLKNQYGYPVASGVYVARVKSGGNERMLKIALVQESQVLKYY